MHVDIEYAVSHESTGEKLSLDLCFPESTLCIMYIVVELKRQKLWGKIRKC